MALGLQSIVVVGHLGDLELGAGALGFMFCNVTGFSFMVGLLSAFDSLGAQALGSRRFELVGVLAQRGFLLCLSLSPLVCALWFFAEPLLVLLRLDAELAALTAQFVRLMMPALPLYAAVECVKRWLQVQSIVWPILGAAVVAVLVGALSAYLLVVVLGLGFAGAPLALVATYVAFLAALLAYVRWSRVYERTWSGWRLREAVRDLLPFLRLGAAGSCMHWSVTVAVSLLKSSSPRRRDDLCGVVGV